MQPTCTPNLPTKIIPAHPVRPAYLPCDKSGPGVSVSAHESKGSMAALTIRPISLLRLSLLRFLDSDFPGNYYGHENPPLKFKIMLEPNPLKSRNLSSEIGRIDIVAVSMLRGCILRTDGTWELSEWMADGSFRCL